MKLTIHGKPISWKNSRNIAVVNGRRIVVKNQRQVDWLSDAIVELRSQYKGYAIKDKGLTVELVCYCGSGRMPDIDNIAAGVLDALERARIIENDSQIDRLVIERSMDMDDPRVEILLRFC